MEKIIKEIESLHFGVYSAQEIKNMSVVEVNTAKLSGPGSVYDDRMGKSKSSSGKCESCKKIGKYCPGHFGHIELSEQIYNPLFYKMILLFLKCVCLFCNQFLVNENRIKIAGFDRCKKEVRLKKIIDLVSKTDRCFMCGALQPKIGFSPNDGSLNEIYYIEGKKDKTQIPLDIERVKNIFESITNEDIELMGLDPDMIHPKNLILTVLPVLPPACRPFLSVDGNISDDDLTNQYNEIIKINNSLKTTIEPVKRKKLIQTLKFKVSTLFNNSHGKSKHQTNNRPIKGLKERISGKEGLIRDNLMGKRVNFSARTVIGADPTLKLDELAIPIEVAHILTIPERVTPFNIERMTYLVNNEKAHLIYREDLTKEEKVCRINIEYASQKKGTRVLFGDTVHRGVAKYQIRDKKFILKEGDEIYRNGKKLENIEYPVKTPLSLVIGDVVERYLQDGDTVLLNRQPTLHSGSMMAFKVKVRPFKTFRFNLAVTKSFNADFDGDEMNIHVPRSFETRAELEELSAVTNHMISPQTSKPNLCIVQDALLGSYKMTLSEQLISRDAFFDIALMGTVQGKQLWSPEKAKTIPLVYKKFGKNYSIFCGKTLFSLLLPADMYYELKNGADPDEPVVRIFNGVLYEGAISKAIIGSSPNSLIQILHKEYGPSFSAEFINNVHFIANKWLEYTGFSIGLGDCMIEDMEKNKEIQNTIAKCYLEAKSVQQSIANPIIKEIKTMAALNSAKDVGLKIAKESMRSDNNFLSTVRSGSKGDFFNIAQITGLLGQQNLTGKRISPSLNHSTRSLPHYPFVGITDEDDYESRGFIKNSFIHGLNPKEFYFHAISAREAICDTAMGTAKSGYLQRRIVKTCEDLSVQYDGTVRDIHNRIYSLAYGDDGFDPKKTVNIDNSCDVSRLVHTLNMAHENNVFDDICLEIEN